jgi:hypothetical protein
VVDEMPAWVEARLPTIAAVHDEVAEDRRRAEAPQAG